MIWIDGEHQSASLEMEQDGWYFAECTCGWRLGPLPDTETTCDALMQHAFAMGEESARRAQASEPAPPA